jgi:nitroreductase
MDILEAIRARHSVRKYVERPIGAVEAERLKAAVERINAESGLDVQLVRDEPKAFSGLFISTYGQFSGVTNYFVMAGPKGKEAEEKVGWYGEELVLLAQTLGLNTCWVGLTYKKVPGSFTLREGDKIHCVIALGYGANQGVQHPLRPVEKFYEAVGEVPEWFLKGMEAALLAPTAVNQQKFKFILHADGSVEAKPLFSMIGYTIIDLGIVKHHFELGAGKEHFRWR